MPTELIVIRHGNAVRVNGQYRHAPLTLLGRQQATQTGQYLRQLHPRLDGFYSSPLQRARETAVLIGAELGLSPQLEANLREFEWTELPALALFETFAALDPADAYLQAHVGKPLRWPLEGRVSQALAGIVAGHPGGRVVVVAHSGVICAALVWYFPRQRLHWWMTRVGNCSLTRLQVDGTRAELLGVDETEHLTPVPATSQPPSQTVSAAARALQAGIVARRKRGG